MKKKDTRVVYTQKEIKCNGNVVSFDGKGDKDAKQLKVYRYYGDITIREEALQGFAIENGYDTLLY